MVQKESWKGNKIKGTRREDYTEGKAMIAAGKAFFNPESRFSRDISVAFVSVIAKKETSVLDATTATGIRGIRYYKETPAKRITMLDINRQAFLSAMRNIKSNKVKAKLLNKSIQEFCNGSREHFDVVDYDPFGGVSPAIFDLFKVARGGGYLMFTATDTAVLCGAHENACLRYYDAKPLHNELCFEVGLRLLVGYSARIAAQFNFGIEPKVAFSYKHYMRVMLQLKHGAENARQSIKSMGYAHMCNKCGWRSTELSAMPMTMRCPDCGGTIFTAGKIWLGRLNDVAVLKKVLSKGRKSFEKEGLKLLETIISESDTPLYYSIPRISKLMHLPSVSPSKVIERLKEMGFMATRTHFDKDAVKTDALIKDVKLTLSQSQGNKDKTSSEKGDKDNRNKSQSCLYI